MGSGVQILQNTVLKCSKPEAGEPFQLSAENGDRIIGAQHETGSKAVGVFVHGFRSTRLGDKSQAFMEHAIQKGYSWRSFDLRGHGDSDGLFEAFTLSNALQDLLSVLDSIGDREILLVGSSLGGWLSLLAAQRRFPQIKAMMLIAPAFNFIQNFFGSLPQRQLDAWANSGRCEFTDIYDGSTFSLHHKILDDAKSYTKLPTTWPNHCPVKIIHGDQDQVVSLDISRQLTERYATENIDLHVIEGGDHRLNQYIPEMCNHIDALWEQMKRDY